MNYNDKPKRIITDKSTGGVLGIKGKGDKVKLKAISGYTKTDVMSVLKDTGENLEFTFKTWFPENYPELRITLDYSQAHDMYLLLEYLVDFCNLSGKHEKCDFPRKSKQRKF